VKTGPENYREASRLLDRAANCETNGALSELISSWAVGHALLAVAAAAALQAANTGELLMLAQGKSDMVDPIAVDWINAIGRTKVPTHEGRHAAT
jgi:hypothetical protein